jgi:CubicO group peptidase (beta-lactamase class C family)
VPEFFDDVFARPMGIDHYHVNLTPTGEAYGGGGMYLRPRDLLKFGQLVLQHGSWKGRQLVPADWLKTSLRRRAKAPDGSWDGLGWHLHTVRWKARTLDLVEANGNGGQFLMILPKEALVVVITAGNYNQYGVWRTFRETWLPEYLMPPSGPSTATGCPPRPRRSPRNGRRS